MTGLLCDALDKAALIERPVRIRMHKDCFQQLLREIGPLIYDPEKLDVMGFWRDVPIVESYPDKNASGWCADFGNRLKTCQAYGWEPSHD